MATQKNRILAIIDPTRTEQWALKKALSIASNRDDLDVCAYLCVHSDADCGDKDQLQVVELERHKLWLEAMLTEYTDDNLTIDSQIEWSDDWREAVCEAGAADDVALVVKRTSGRQISLASSDRQLIRKLGRALLLVKYKPADEIKKILIAVDFNAEDESHKALNEAIMSLGRRMRGTLNDTELHVISAYPSSDSFVHPPDVAKALDIPRSHAHVRRGSAADIIPDVAKELEPDLVIVGNVGRVGLSGITIGNTAEKILSEIAADVLVLVIEEVEASAAA
jgi:universal stress protein E